MNVTLKKCPFCGNDVILEDHRLIWCIRCICGITMLSERVPEPEQEMPSSYYEKYITSLVNKWNKRFDF